ncbi:VanW family protein [Sporosarcina quadrami]
MKKWTFALIILCSIGMLGCQKLSEIDQVVEIEETESNLLVGKPIETATELQEDIPEIAPVVIEIIDPNTLETLYTFSPEELGYEEDIETYKGKIVQLAKDLARGTDERTGYDQRMILDRIDEQGGIIKGSPLILLKESQLVERILEATDVGGTVILPIEIFESGYDPGDVPNLDEVMVASYTTYFNQADTGRNRNIELSAQAIHNVIVGSGDYFSFNTVVGPRNEEKGYQPAPEIVNKELVMGIGGGICQTSSTMFNAIDQIPVKYVERHHHSLDIGYVPKGRDATVSYGGLDFRFQNTNEVPFMIKSIYGSQFLTIEIRTAAKFKDSLVR